MQNEERIIELLAEQLLRQDRLIGEMEQMNQRLGRVEDQQAKTNLAIGELRLSVTEAGR